MVNDPDIDESALRAITAPTLVIAGTRDMIKREHTKKIAENIPDSRRLFIEGDHFIARKNAACFNAAVDKFLSEEQR